MHRLILIAALLLCACNLTQGEVIPPTPSIPTVEFQFPTNNVAVVSGTDLQIQVLAQDAVGVARIELAVDGQPHQTAAPVDSETVPVFTVDMNWLAEGVGFHSLQATAYRLDGTSSDPVLINVNVTAAQ
ncbi:MAG: Ig-like domain-containing protein [Chloroflexota bacterium]